MTETTSPPAAPAALRPVIRFQPGRHKRFVAGHPWAYSNEIVLDAAARALPGGSLVSLCDASGKRLGTGFFNPHTLMTVRRLDTAVDHPVDAGFFAHRLHQALTLRERLFPRPFYRLIHAEADQMPGLVVDRFGPVVVIQSNSAGMERLLAPLCAALQTTLAPETLIVRRDSPARLLEGLEVQPPEIIGRPPENPVPVDENGLTFLADVHNGQKTGWFFDQRDNRAFAATLAAGQQVLDLYSFQGGFALACAQAGAASVLAVDRSAAALALARHAACRNGLAERCAFLQADVFATLEQHQAAGARFGLVIADPPAFVKSRKDLAAGLRGYRKLARLAAGVTAPEGFLVMASCSHNVEPALFAETVAHGLADAGRSGRLLRQAGAGADHPVHPFLPETAYLKALTYQLF